MGKIEINIPPQDMLDEVSVTRYIVYEMLRQSDMSLSSAISKYNLVFKKNQTIQNISNKLTRNSMRLYELAQLASVCNFRLCLVGNVKDSPIVNKDDSYSISLLEDNEKQNEQLALSDFEPSAISESIPRPKDNIKPIRQTSKSFDELLEDGYCESKTINLGLVIIAGAKCKEAAQWISEHLTNDMDDLQERMLFARANRRFNVKWKHIEKNMAILLGLIDDEI